MTQSYLMEIINQQDPLFHKVLYLSLSVIVDLLKHELISRDKSVIESKYATDNVRLFSKLNELLGEEFIRETLTNAHERIKKGEPSKLQTQEGIDIAPIERVSIFEDFMLAAAYGYEIAFSIFESLKTLKSYHSSTQLLKNLLEIPKPSVEPQLFKDKNSTPISTSSPMLSGLEAQIRKDLWTKDSNKNAYYRKEAKRNPNNFIEHYVSQPDDVVILPLDEAQQIIDKFGFNTAKLHLLFAAHCMNKNKPWSERFYLKASDIIKDLGWDRRTDLSKNKLFKEVASTAFVLSCLLVKTTWVEGTNRKGQIQASCPIGRMWDVVVVPQGQLNTQGTIDEPYEVVISVRPGGWTEHFLNKAGVEAREALYQFGWLSKEVLKIDPYRNELALRLALFLTIEHRSHKSGKYKVKTLLEKVLPASELKIIHDNFRRRHDSKKQWDNALKLLTNLGWKVDYDSETYPTWLQPENSERKPKGYIDKFLEAIIFIHPPEKDSAEPINQIKLVPSNHDLPKADATVFNLRKLRDALGWSQRRLAKELDVSQSLITKIERGERDIQPEMGAKLTKLMQSKGLTLPTAISWGILGSTSELATDRFAPI